jgi:hypothetical protein
MAKAYLYDLTDTWNAGATTFTAFKMNVTDTASNAASLLLDLQIGGSSRVSVTKGGVLTTLGRSKINTLTVGLGGQTSVSTNTAIGFEALNSASLTGVANTGVGYQALANNTTGNFNAALGHTALGSNTTGGGNSALGVSCLSANTTASSNTAMGESAMRFTTTGGNNTAVGLSALRENTTAANNAAVGVSALRNFNTGNNVAVGYEALTGSATVANNTGSDLTAVGYRAGDAITTGSRNTIIGANSDPSAAGGIDQTVVGEGLTGKGDDTAFIGGSNGAYNEKNVTTWETTSDARIKKNITSNSVGLEVISQIDVRNFEYRTAEEITELPTSVAIAQPGIQLGVIAQELQAILPACVTENSTGVLSVNTDPLIWYLVNAVKQLSARINALEGKITNA